MKDRGYRRWKDESIVLKRITTLFTAPSFASYPSLNEYNCGKLRKNGYMSRYFAHPKNSALPPKSKFSRLKRLDHENELEQFYKKETAKE